MILMSRKVSSLANFMMDFHFSLLASAPSQAEVHLKMATEESANDSDIASISWLSSGINLEESQFVQYELS